MVLSKEELKLIKDGFKPRINVSKGIQYLQMRDSNDKRKSLGPYDEAKHKEIEEYIKKVEAESVVKDEDNGTVGKKVDLRSVEEIDYHTAFQMLDEGNTPTDLIFALKLDPTQLLNLYKMYNEVKAEVFKRYHMETRKLHPWFMICNKIGEQIREKCEYYDDVAGICNSLALSDLDPQIRLTYAGMFKSDGSHIRVKIRENPEVCVACRRLEAMT